MEVAHWDFGAQPALATPSPYFASHPPPEHVHPHCGEAILCKCLRSVCFDKNFHRPVEARVRWPRGRVQWRRRRRQGRPQRRQQRSRSLPSPPHRRHCRRQLLSAPPHLNGSGGIPDVLVVGEGHPHAASLVHALALFRISSSFFSAPARAREFGILVAFEDAYAALPQSVRYPPLSRLGRVHLAGISCMRVDPLSI
jgi:hypothetical protein